MSVPKQNLPELSWELMLHWVPVLPEHKSHLNQFGWMWISPLRASALNQGFRWMLMDLGSPVLSINRSGISLGGMLMGLGSSKQSFEWAYGSEGYVASSESVWDGCYRIGFPFLKHKTALPMTLMELFLFQSIQIA
ncbi:hypothetical protein AVEN_212830-1 [Araneus ventricosus]|uniref:Uncharacterized protein n=1 Tax=Araneus ventricosus TaxID=182803 RepID=A0A4Y2CG91_ARAVE|nr:hypothetical protein AVEN_212830-1 [Araneus ventricosus]